MRIAGLPQTVGFQASLILIQPDVAEPAQTFWVVKIAPRGSGASAGASTGCGSRCPGDGAFAGAEGAAGRLAATPAGTSSVAAVRGPGLETPLLQATRVAFKGVSVGVNTPIRVP